MCPHIKRIWMFLSVAWIAYIAWRMHVIWPTIPLDMGGASPSRDAAYQAAQLQHVAKGLGLALGVPVITYIVGWLVCRMRGNGRSDAA